VATFRVRLAQQDEVTAASQEEITRLHDEEIERKDDEIALLKAHLLQLQQPSEGLPPV
jgi:hypothetical protein